MRDSRLLWHPASMITFRTRRQRWLAGALAATLIASLTAVLLKPKLERGSNAAYWVTKIAANVDRDRRNTALLEQAGWLVVRLWETDIKLDTASVAREVSAVVRARQQGRTARAAGGRRTPCSGPLPTRATPGWLFCPGEIESVVTRAAALVNITRV